ncbi:hypothetical protein AURDEDRAFT_117914, partial [Auricularia subglabra TFB-10046 SS5]
PTVACRNDAPALVSRQFRELSRARIESLLTSFTTLIPPNSQHTSVETADVRYVYQPLDDLYVLLVTNKASNILQDIDTLHLVARVASDTCHTPDEREILAHAFTLLAAFDEIVSLGYRENINLMQVRNALEMDSHEEKIQEIIARNKEAEAKEELKRRAKALEMQRRDQQRRGQGGSGGVGYLGSAYGGSGSYSPVPRQASPAPTPFASSGTSTTITAKAPAFKGSGMKLGATKKAKNDILDAMGAADEPAQSEPEPEAAPAPAAAAPAAAANTPPPGAGIHAQIRETLSLALTREGGLNLVISQAPLAKAKLVLAPLGATGATALQFKQHPNVAKFATVGDRAIALKDKSRSFPVGQPLGVLKWRYADKDEAVVPLSINCWPTPNNDGTCDVNIEYELEASQLTLRDLTISIPLPTGSYPTVAGDAQ